MGRGRFYTEAELCRALDLKARGLTWVQIAERLGRSYRSLTATICYYRKGQWNSERTRLVRERNARMIEAAETGESISVIAKREGLSLQLVCTTLYNYGLDAEVRTEIRRELAYRESCQAA